MKIHIGDTVLILAGKDRGKTGKITRVSAKRNQAVIEGVNIRTKHIKKKRAGESGQRIRFEAPINASNVAVICPHCKKKTRVSYARLESGKKYRMCKKCKQSLDLKIEKKTVKRK